MPGGAEQAPIGELDGPRLGAAGEGLGEPKHGAVPPRRATIIAAEDDDLAAVDLERRIERVVRAVRHEPPAGG